MLRKEEDSSCRNPLLTRGSTASQVLTKRSESRVVVTLPRSTPFVRVSPRRWLYVDEPSRKEVKDILIPYDRTLLVADPRRCEPKKFGGRGARSRFQKSYR
ncbi:unnamed protein product [Brassica oleracea]